MKALALIVAMLFATSVQAAEDDAPAIHQGPHFYNAIGGNDLTIEATATPTDVSLGEAITYSITIRHVKNPSKVMRPDFFKLTEFGLSFGIYPQDITTKVEGDTVTFTWKMRPRTVDETTIPGLKFEYYNPNAAAGKALPTLYTEPIPITVRPKEKTAVPPTDVITQRVDETVPNAEPPEWRHWLAIGIVLLPGTALYVYRWRWRNPHGAQLTALKRNRVTRQALAKLSAARDADAVAAALREYLQDRPRHAAIEQVLRSCDEIRFGNLPNAQLSANAIAAIQESERELLTNGAEPGPASFPFRDVLMTVIALAGVGAAFGWSVSSGYQPPDEQYVKPGFYINEARKHLVEGNRASAVFTVRDGLRDFPTNPQLRIEWQSLTGPETASIALWQMEPNYRRLYTGGWAFGLLASVALAKLWTTRPRGSGLLVLVGVAGVIACLIVDGTGKRRLEREQLTTFVVLAEPSRFRNGNGESYESVLAEPLPIGAEFAVQETRNGWHQVELANGVMGWVLKSQVLLNKPPNASAMRR